MVKNLKRQWKRPLLLGILIILLVLSVGSFYVMNASHSSARSQAIHVAKTKGGLQTTTFYSEFDRRQQFYTVGGQTRQGYRYVVINGQNGKIQLLNSPAGLVRQVRQTVQNHQNPKQINKVALGYYQKHPVWEVTYRNQNNSLGYYLINFHNTKILQVINNL
ncbi:peptidase [Bombilactobacillus folatiphilus]|uniref:Peptidase n=1 Tax=Bombilactobacillus folatiphilus TaxID=2923362 RepID=A0ABY4P7G9_9LACO|nr:peptidase [Bombilactobacillus folatiphilus]UQS81496.1 peptidase [Bombilactobacillus folatiphilus]